MKNAIKVIMGRCSDWKYGGLGVGLLFVPPVNHFARNVETANVSVWCASLKI